MKRAPLAVVSALIALGACSELDNDCAVFGRCEETTSCEDAASPMLPGDFTCDGPDTSGWDNAGKPDGAGACPSPPAGSCSQVVIGRQSDTARYIECPGYVVLNRDDWTPDMNDSFVACTADGQVGTCDPPVVVVSDSDQIGEPDMSGGTVVAREICQFISFGCEVSLADTSGPGSVTCGDAPPIETGFRIWRVTNYDAAGGYITVRAFDADQDPPLLSTFPGGGIDPDLRAELAVVTDSFDSREEAVDSVCSRISDYYRPPLASFVLKASFDGVDVGIGEIFQTRCPDP